MKRILWTIVVIEVLAARADARLLTWCGGGAFAVDKKTGSELASWKLPEMELGGFAPLHISVSANRTAMRLVFGKCRPNPNTRDSATWIPAEVQMNPLASKAEVATVTLTTDALVSTTSFASENWAPSLTPNFPDLDTGIVSLGGRNLSFNEGEGQLCLMKKRGQNAEWCFPIDPYSRRPRAGPSAGVSLYNVPEGYFVVTNWFGAFLLDKTTGLAKWHLPYSNMDFVPAVLDAGDRWILAPDQLMDNHRETRPN